MGYVEHILVTLFEVGGGLFHATIINIDEIYLSYLYYITSHIQFFKELPVIFMGIFLTQLNCATRPNV